jgi:hypothetical protein
MTEPAYAKTLALVFSLRWSLPIAAPAIGIGAAPAFLLAMRLCKAGNSQAKAGYFLMNEFLNFVI